MLILIRGLPGSGKSTIARMMGSNSRHCEADMFFCDIDGNYSFDASKIKEAHAWCQEQARYCLGMSYNVIVSNTFTH